ncbi:hypothetical protein, variant [Cryptococcus amylolentus CBS 6039]|uniref:Uncharacterized protein n=2 Tax=Cryptococcus amylolentus TaxID=104669 RepID=A0A1E3I770_9TREE|nr:hypothetical protein, variant [Cryptococcus amylolentus CBS 6039]ODN84338.1 hypothetical protein, variant [Cryptococcus amylolentus CBS 6039]ODO11835.1 hypothetical protein I350_00619 [Cryptococcus amylolentus CBS 6273]
MSSPVTSQGSMEASLCEKGVILEQPTEKTCMAPAPAQAVSDSSVQSASSFQSSMGGGIVGGEQLLNDNPPCSDYCCSYGCEVFGQGIDECCELMAECLTETLQACLSCMTCDLD